VKDVSKEQRERLMCEILMVRLEVERLTVLCQRLTVNGQDAQMQLDQINDNYDKQLLLMFCGLREEFS